MARTKRKTNPVIPAAEAPAQAQKRYRTAAYARLSVEDSGKPGADTIEGQKNLLLRFIENDPTLTLYGLFCDNGQTGTDFQRPEFEKLMEAVKHGEVDCIVVKDLSRFGRNYKETGNYLERIFPFLGVRFIAVNDGFDTLTAQRGADGYLVPLKNLINEVYSKDISRKSGSALAAKQKNGDFIGAWAPYGYRKCPDDPHKLEPDEATAPIVRQIFQWRAEGVSITQIARQLNDRGVPSPSAYLYNTGVCKTEKYVEAADVIRRIFQMAADGAKPWQIAAALNGDGVISPKNYKAETGCTRTPWRSIQEENFWTASLVAKFLRDERYIGKTVFGKRSRDIVGSTHTVKISRNDWIVVPDRHEAIVPEALFQKAQDVMREYREYEAASGSGNPLKRKVICGVCGHAMQRDSRKNGTYRCVTKRLNTGFDCSEDRIPEADILEAVIDTIQVYAQYAVSIDRLLRTRQEQRQLDRKQAQHRLQTLQSRKAQLDERLQDLYERLVEGEISRESFAAQKKALTAQAEEISHTVLELERKISGSDDGSNAAIEQFKSYAGITALTKEISTELLQSITIYPDGRMDIRLNLADEIEALMETLRRESCTA